MISKLDKSEHWIVKLWSSDPQLTRAISNLEFSEHENSYSRCPNEGVVIYTHRDYFWRLGLELAQTLHTSLWGTVNISIALPEDESVKQTLYTFTDFHHHFVAPWLSEAIVNREVVCFCRPIAEAANHPNIVANEYFLRLEGDGKSVCMRDLFEFSDRFGLHSDLHWMAIEYCLPHCFSLDRKAFVNVDSANFFSDCYSWTEILDATAENSSAPGNIVFEVSLIGDGDEKLLADFSREIRARGFEVALDDWGLKNNSIRALDLVRPDYVKVSEKLIHGMHSDSYRQKLLSGLVNLATDLGIKTIAEGVSNADDSSCAINAGFLWLQGDYVGKPSTPLPPDASIGCAPLYSASVGNETLIGKCQ